MPYYQSFRQIRKNLMKAMPTPAQRAKREFILGYLEGHAERRAGSSEWRISAPRLEEALKKLSVGHESTAPVWRQVLPEDVSKIKGQFQNLPGRRIPYSQQGKMPPAKP